jgi:hypothetical protein
MSTRPRTTVMAALTVLVLLALPPGAAGQAACTSDHDSLANACFIGSPDAQGVTLRVALDRFGQTRAYKFQFGPEASTAQIYLGDLWYALEASLWREAAPSAGGSAPQHVSTLQANESRVLQFVRPAGIVERLEPGAYLLLVRAGSEESFTPRRGFTLRVALGPPACATQRDAAGLYQLGLVYEPREPTPSSLMSFSALVNPPYSDLFDFDWQIDGRPMPDADRTTLQLAASDLPAARGEHRVQVTARGVREYPDPDPRFRHVPPTLTVVCTFPAP